MQVNHHQSSEVVKPQEGYSEPNQHLNPAVASSAAEVWQAQLLLWQQALSSDQQPLQQQVEDCLEELQQQAPCSDRQQASAAFQLNQQVCLEQVLHNPAPADYLVELLPNRAQEDFSAQHSPVLDSGSDLLLLWEEVYPSVPLLKGSARNHFLELQPQHQLLEDYSALLMQVPPVAFSEDNPSRWLLLSTLSET